MTENHINSVGTIYQDGREFHFNLPPPRPRTPLYAALRRVDRTAQAEQLAEGVETMRRHRRRAPLVIVAHGNAEDDIPGFMQRVGEHDLAADLGVACDYLGTFDWPERSTSLLVQKLLRHLSQRRSDLIPDLAHAEDSLAALIASHHRSVMFGHLVTGDLCRRRPDVLDAWVELVTQKLSNPAGGLLICFLGVQLRSPQAPECSWLLDHLQQHAHANGWCLLDRLSVIERWDLEQWVARYNLDPALDDLQHIESRLLGEVFGDASALPYRQAVERLLKALEPSLMPQAPRFAA